MVSDPFFQNTQFEQSYLEEPPQILVEGEEEIGNVLIFLKNKLYFCYKNEVLRKRQMPIIEVKTKIWNRIEKNQGQMVNLLFSKELI